MLRLFVAIDLPEDVKQQLADVQDRLRSRLGPAARAARWAPPAGLHLTLAFLGNVPEPQVAAIDAALAPVAAASRPFDLWTAGLGAFPNASRPRHVWGGIAGEIERLLDARERVVGALEEIAFPRERKPFAPHLTLARVRESARREDIAAYARVLDRPPQMSAAEIPVREIVLFRSELSSSGASYSRVRTWPVGVGVGG